MGRRQTLDVIKKLTGAAKKDPARLNPGQPKTKGYPTRPVLLTDPVAIAEYDRIARLLHDLRLVGEAGSMALWAYAEEFATYANCVQGVNSKGVLVSGKNGPVTNPYLRMRQKSVRLMLQMVKELGLSPSARQSLRMAQASPLNPNAKGSDPWDRFSVLDGGKY